MVNINAIRLAQFRLAYSCSTIYVVSFTTFAIYFILYQMDDLWIVLYLHILLFLKAVSSKQQRSNAYYWPLFDAGRTKDLEELRIPLSWSWYLSSLGALSLSYVGTVKPYLGMYQNQAMNLLSAVVVAKSR
jgi:hypothetical protein